MCTYVDVGERPAGRTWWSPIQKELLLGDVHLRVGDARVGERAEGRWAALGSRLWQELPSNLGSSFVALGRVNRRNRHVTCLGSGPTFRMKH